MSTNIYIRAIREVTFVRPNGKKGVDYSRKEFTTFQTPTKVTLEILSKANQEEELDCYIKWAQQSSANNSASGSDKAANIKEANRHVKELREFVRASEEDGYNIEVYSM